MTLERDLTQLQEQQGAITRALAAANDGRWTCADSGADSVEGWLLALNPTWTGQLVPLQPRYAPDEPDEVPANIVWVGSPNHYNGRAGLPVSAIVLHTMAGSLASCDAWFSNPASQVSSHYGVGLEGQQHQYVALFNGSWANGIIEPHSRWPRIVGNRLNPNYQTVTVETEDLGRGSTEVTDAQYASTLAVCRLAQAAYPSIRYLMGHNVISPNSRPQCCGDRWWASGRFSALADDLGLEAHF